MSRLESRNEAWFAFLCHARDLDVLFPGVWMHTAQYVRDMLRLQAATARILKR